MGKPHFSFELQPLTETDAESARRLWRLNFTLPIPHLVKASVLTPHFHVATGAVYLLLLLVVFYILGAASWQSHLLILLLAVLIQMAYLFWYFVNNAETPDNRDMMGFWSDRPQTRRFAVVRCLETGEVAGTVAMMRTSEDDPKAELIRLRVLDKFFGYGLGRRLIKWCEEIAREWGCREIFLYTVEYHDFGMKLYEKYGFKYTADTLLGKPYPGLTLYSLYYEMPVDPINDAVAKE